jgi:nitroreductase
MNETLQVIAARYACRDFTGEMVEEASLRAIARAAVEAPSALNRQPWRVVVVKDRELMGEMEAEGMRQLAAMEDSSGYGRIMSRAEAFQKRLQFPKGYVFGCAVLLGYGRQGKAPHAPDLEKIVFVE